MPGLAKVLLVGHDASRTGAPLVALRWLRWASATGAVDAAVWLDRGGELLEAFAATCPTRVGAGLRQRAGQGLAAAGVHRARVRPVHELGGPPIVVANTLAAWASAARVARRSRLVVWVHELDHVAERIVTEAERTRLLGETDHLIAVGDRVAEMLRTRWHVPSSMVSTAPSFLDPLPDDVAPPVGPHHIVGIGSLTPRKGPDAFVAVVAALTASQPHLRAAWVGGPLASPTAALIRHDIAGAGLARLELTGEVPDATQLLPRDGLLLHPAREDPDPLAVLEAAQRAVPVVTWDTGGAADLLQRAGLHEFVAPAGDLAGLATRARMLLDHPRDRRAAGDALRLAAAERTTEVVAPQVLAAIVGGAA